MALTIAWHSAKASAQSITQMTTGGLVSYWLAKIIIGSAELHLANEGVPIRFSSYDEALKKAQEVIDRNKEI